MTIRRAQGSTLDLIGLFFDRRRADRGYAYVGASRVRHHAHLWLVGNVRSTDWLPVGEDPDGGEQLRPGVDKQSDSEDDEEMANTESDSEDDPAEAEGFGVLRGLGRDDEASQDDDAAQEAVWSFGSPSGEGQCDAAGLFGK